jgi:uncharacterized membrane protein (TIGR02234 family)
MAGESGTRGRRELAALLLCGAAGAGLVLLGTRQQVASVVVTAPHPLPVTMTPVSAQDLLPAASALAVAALASLAAVLATRGLLRRITGLVTAALGIGVAITAAASLKAAEVLTAAGHANLSPANGAGGGVEPGSTTAGTDGGSTAGVLAGFPSHVEFAGPAWRVLMLAGTALIIVIGCAIIVRAGRLPAMSSRYERTARSAVPLATEPLTTGPPTTGSLAAGSPAAGSLAAGSLTTGPPASGPPSARPAVAGMATSVAASMWDSLNAGTDPTATPGDGGVG